MNILPLDPADYYPILDARQPPALVIFTAPACGACRRLKAILAQLPPFPDTAVYEVSAERAGGLVEELEIFHLPALFLYQDGDLHAPIHARLTADSLREAIETARAGPPAIQ